MHYATTSRMARPSGKPLGRRTILHCHAAVGALAISIALLLTPARAHAQGYPGAATAPVVPLPAGFAPHETVPPEALSPERAPSLDNASEIVHVIEVGDNLTNVASRYKVKPADLAAYNQILDYNHVVLGQQLRIPPVGVTITEPAVVDTDTTPGFDGYHVVRIGESLSAIARLYNLSLDELMALNDISDPNLVQMGKMLRLTGEVEPPTHAIKPEQEMVIYEVQRGDTLAEIARTHYTTVEQIVEDNSLTNTDVHVGQALRILPPTDAAEAFGVEAPVDGERRIVIDLSDQTLTAYQGDVVVLHSIVSTGKAATPTRVGEFAIYLKYKSQHMTGDDYDLPGVPWVMYYDDEYAIHGAYWHANFGTPTSHGCTNMTIGEAKALYTWAPEGTPVIVQE